MTPSLAIDHALIAVRDLAAAARDFAELGFTLTPLGRHSIGSRNHCIMLGSSYIELLEPAGEHPWLAYYRDFLARGDGLDQVTLTEGPYAESAEQVGGYYLVETDDLDDLGQVCGRLMSTPFHPAIEIRPTMGM